MSNRQIMTMNMLSVAVLGNALKNVYLCTCTFAIRTSSCGHDTHRGTPCDPIRLLAVFAHCPLMEMLVKENKNGLPRFHCRSEGNTCYLKKRTAL